MSDIVGAHMRRHSARGGLPQSVLEPNEDGSITDWPSFRHH
jgi:hypothetical protein